jgi:tape measure domain-containing protein
MAVMAKKLANQFKGDIDAAARQMQAIRGEGPFGKGTRSIPGFKAAAQGMGIENAFKLFFQELKTVDPRRLAKALDDGSVMMMQENREIKQSLDAIQDKAKKLASDLSAMGDAAKTTGKASIERAGKALYPQNYGLKIASLLSSVEKLNSDLRKVSAASGVELSDPLNELSSVLRGLSNSFVDIAGFNRTLDETLRGFDTATKRATQATAAYAERIQRRAGTAPAQATAGPRLLGAHMAPIGPLPHGSQDPWAYNQQAFRYEPRLSQTGPNTGGQCASNARTVSLRRSTVDHGDNIVPCMLGRGFPALPPAGGTAGTREASLALRELAAHGRSAARAASVFAEDAARAAQRSRLQTVSGQMPMGGGGGFLPPRGGVPRGGAPFNGFPSDGMMGPSTTKGQAAIHTLTGSLKDADQYLRQTRVPLAGAIEGLGSEFANATKQVLLYGTAYKALAFFMDLPNQALAAATALQTFRNQLNAVTGSSENASRSFGFIDSLADRFAVPLESVRQGFVRMYASMEPAGFGATEIEGLFTGVSKAAATFGMSKDQVDRVTYALSQMASKGQIMAEELRGQLGDVLPGSFALFAEAAQMSIPEFTKAMEQGRFSGEAMRVVLNNVAILLNTKFASGAEGAAKTLQGALNTMGTGMQRLYESFEPLVNEVAQRVFPLIAEAMADASSGVKAFTAAVRGGNPELQQLSGSARQMYAVMQQLAEIARSIGTVLSGLMPTLAGLGKMIIFALEQLARFVNTPVGGYLANLALQAALVTAALQLMAKVGIFAAVRGLIQLIFQTDAAIWKLKLLIKTSAMAKLGLIGLGAAVVISAIMALNNSLDATNRTCSSEVWIWSGASGWLPRSTASKSRGGNSWMERGP